MNSASDIDHNAGVDFPQFIIEDGNINMLKYKYCGPRHVSSNAKRCCC